MDRPTQGVVPFLYQSIPRYLHLQHCCSLKLLRRYLIKNCAVPIACQIHFSIYVLNNSRACSINAS